MAGETVKRDLIAGTQGTQDVNGFSFTIIYRVTDVVGSTAVERLANAIIAPGVPVYGTDLSLIDPALAGSWLRSKTAVPDGDPSSFKVTLVYKQERLTVIESIVAGSSVNSVDTNIDINGNTMSVSYEYPDPYPLSPDLAGETVTQGGLVQKMLPEPTLVYVVREPLSPLAFREFYENKVNKFFWNGGEPGEWLCTSITGISDGPSDISPDGFNYKNTYSFQQRATRDAFGGTDKTGWQANVLFKDTKTGNPPPDLVKLPAGSAPVPGTIYGDRVYDIYDEADFFELFPSYSV